MSESTDPRVAIEQGDVATRAAAARDLARQGSWEDVALLVDKAKNDTSPSVRLYTAAAAADIVCRMRGAGGRPRLTRDQCDQLQNWVKTFDPGINPSLLMLLSAVADQASIDRVGRMLKDPRNGVRAGAATALRRMALSAASVGDTLLGPAIEKMLANRKLPEDAVVELVRLVGEAGWSALEPELRAAGGRVAGPAADEALARLAARRDPSAWEGVWVSDGVDVFEPVEEPKVDSWLVISGAEAWDADGRLGTLTLRDGGGSIDARPFRMVFAPRVGEAGQFPALQHDGRTWYRQDAKGLVSVTDEIIDALAAEPARALAGWLGAVEGVLAQRARALALWRAGAWATAREILESLIAEKKPKADTYWYLARIRAAEGDKGGALQAIEEFLDKAGKRARWRKEAEEFRDSLA